MLALSFEKWAKWFDFDNDIGDNGDNDWRKENENNL